MLKKFCRWFCKGLSDGQHEKVCQPEGSEAVILEYDCNPESVLWRHKLGSIWLIFGATSQWQPCGG